jgi:hypothetical protein
MEQRPECDEERMKMNKDLSVMKDEVKYSNINPNPPSFQRWCGELMKQNNYVN